MAATKPKPKKLLILGGGYSAIYACRKLKRSIRKGRLDVTVVTKENFHIWHGFIGEMLSGRILPSSLLTPARRLFRPAKIHNAIITGIDTKKKQVKTIREIDGRPRTMDYDYLLVCMGTRQNTQSYPGLEEHAYKLKTWDHCYQLKNHIIRMFEMASITEDAEERRAMMTYFVAGGGFSGTEVAGELADLARLLCKKDFPNLSRDEFRIVLVHPGEHILPELYGNRVDERQVKQWPKLVRYVEKRLRKNGVELYTKTRVKAVTPNLVLLDNGERIPARTIISAVGTRPQLVVHDSDLPVENGRILCDEFLNIQGHSDVWGSGDCAAIPHIKGGFAPPVAWWAMMEGRDAAKNIIRTFKGKPMKRFKRRGLGQAVSVGRRTAVGEIKGIPFRGKLGWILWRIVLFYYFPSLQGKTRLLVDWALWPFFGRDIIEMSLEDTDDFEIYHAVWQKDELIVEQGSRGHSLFIISEGEVEISRDVDGDGIPDIIRTVSRGEYIGHEIKDGVARNTARALSQVKGIEMRIDEAAQLQEIVHLLDLASKAREEE